MFRSIIDKLVDSNIISKENSTSILQLAEEYIEDKSISNHRKRKYVLGGSILFYYHNKTDEIYRPNMVATKIGNNMSPSKLTFMAYKIADTKNETYQKPTTKDFAYKYASLLDCREEVNSYIEKLYNDVGELSGKSESCTGAALVYIASLLGNDKRTQSEIAQVSGRSQVGIRNLYYEIVEKSQINVELES